MTDNELIALAAKAAGAEWSDYSDQTPDHWQIQHADKVWRMWSPLTDDGDAFRLAVHLALFNGAQMFHFRSLERFGNPHATELECTRRAIVLAAAEIGRRS
ncbi:hypothetical protein D3C81_966410 [compost metagenome]